ncbi:histidine phosphatase family protein [Radiobacillus kanasensis]|uniref:histidine phosphatase family protein n=1 Tax=Radiobacillus kanasensis TaxID=2844358 RepID=UPI001E630BAE|nr:histidine phosphatase family protein [Radiobacillus kanasensis]UFU01323.1 histidine phosphatase family protein [Radiobacillus kanasensis]
MSTYVYMVRHGESPKEGNERTRGLTQKGHIDAQRVTDILKDEKMDAVVSSPYIRSILTVEKLAKQLGQEVLVYEDLKERIFSSKDNRVSDKELVPLLEKSFLEENFALEGGESNADCQKRAIKVLKELLETYRNKKIVIGSHGAVMTLMMGYFDSDYDLNFLHSTSKPDIYRMEFNEQELVNVKRLWSVNNSFSQYS